MKGHSFVAVDIGASSGRLISGHLEGKKLKTGEIHRFTNGYIEKNGVLCWQLGRLFDEIIIGLSGLDTPPESIGIDTWGVDFVLLDKDFNVLGDTVSYRDSRTKDMDKEVQNIISDFELYKRTGIQKQIFNTIYQLYSIKLNQPEILNAAKHFLMVPDYLNFLLTGKLTNEYTNATTTGLVNARTKDWDFEIIKELGLPTHIFKGLTMPGTTLGPLRPEIAKRAGYQTKVVLPCTHDTGSAVFATPLSEQDNSVYISSGTWSLLGTERPEPDCSEQSFAANFTNEGGYGGRFRYLKNIMGLWMIQSVRRELDKKYTFDELCDMAGQNSTFPSIVNVLDNSFLAPKSMIGAVKDFCKSTNQPVPESIGEVVYCIYNSLAKCYGNTIEELEKLTGRSFKSINIVGGGSMDFFLNRLTAKLTGRSVTVGPIEATSIGNILVQMTAAGEISGINQARNIVRNSFELKEYKSGF